MRRLSPTEGRGPEELARVGPGARVRLFHLEGGERAAVSGVLLAHEPGAVRVRGDDGEERLVELSALACFYVVPPLRGSGLDPAPEARPDREPEHRYQPAGPIVAP